MLNASKLINSKLNIQHSKLSVMKTRCFKQIYDDPEQLQAALKESENRFCCFYDGAFEGLCITADGIFIDCNDQMAVLYGYTTAELIGRPVLDLVADEDKDLVAGHLASGYDKPYEHKSIHKNGALVWVEVCGRPARYQGRPVRVTAVNDITARKEALDLMAKIQAHEHQVSKMEAIGSFAAGIAHDFNNALSPIIGNAGMLIAELTDPDHKAKAVAILTAAETTRQLVHRIQSFSRSGDIANNMAPLALAPVLRDAFAFLRSALPATINIELNVEDPLDTILGSEITIKQILLNLCKNAATAMANETGDITISAKNLYVFTAS